MASLYLIALFGVAALILGVMVDALRAVLRPPAWAVQRMPLALVETVDRRTRNLPYVGADRRQSATGTADDAEAAPAQQKVG